MGGKPRKPAMITNYCLGCEELAREVEELRGRLRIISVYPDYGTGSMTAVKRIAREALGNEQD